MEGKPICRLEVRLLYLNKFLKPRKQYELVKGKQVRTVLAFLAALDAIESPGGTIKKMDAANPILARTGTNGIAASNGDRLGCAIKRQRGEDFTNFMNVSTTHPG